MTQQSLLWGEFASAESLLDAARTLSKRGQRACDAFTPYALPELDELLHSTPAGWIPSAMAFAACLAGGGAFLLIWWTAAISYPLDVGGRPLDSFVTDIPILFESAVLAAACVGFAAALLLSGLPRLDHPLERLAGFERTTQDRYWLAVEAPRDGGLRQTLRELGALSVRTEERDA